MSLNEVRWSDVLSFTGGSDRPIYSDVVSPSAFTSPLYMTAGVRHFPLNGHGLGLLQLHKLAGLGVLAKMFLLWQDMAESISGMQL